MKKIILTSTLFIIAITLFGQSPLDNINTKFDDGTWGEVIPRGSANLPPSGSYPSSKINGFTLTNAAMYGSNTACSKGGKHAVCIILDKQKEGAYVEFPPVKELEELEIHASTGTSGMKFALEEKVKNSWQEVGIYTTQRNDSVYIIKLPREKETALRIRNATNSGLFVYQITTKTSNDVNRVNISKYSLGEGSKISANL
ncbi:MAG: hypothetical protein LBH34_03715, partial [Prevotellaceae bacterium]|nr:hypothetical protein [Prevotellaceae bacterium]